MTAFTFTYYKRTALGLGAPEAWADDCAQEIAIAMQTRPALKIVVKRLAIDWLRKHGTYSRRHASRPEFVPLDDALPVAAPGATDARVMASERAREIRAAYYSLAARDRFVLRATMAGASYEQIAPVLGISTSRVGQLVRRARVQLREALA